MAFFRRWKAARIRVYRATSPRREASAAWTCSSASAAAEDPSMRRSSAFSSPISVFSSWRRDWSSSSRPFTPVRAAGSSSGDTAAASASSTVTGRPSPFSRRKRSTAARRSRQPWQATERASAASNSDVSRHRASFNRSATRCSFTRKSVAAARSSSSASRTRLAPFCLSFSRSRAPSTSCFKRRTTSSGGQAAYSGTRRRTNSATFSVNRLASSLIAQIRRSMSAICLVWPNRAVY
ncbi:MAG: hypothetical protein BWX69_03206 [Planctomycetes bacterium ADurb.Bin069]|nr:MAG: hypothetical protein BWX69_03206 [Planctomycetes bacterium ADurb.Bin069]